jgi:amino acid transporter
MAGLLTKSAGAVAGTISIVYSLVYLYDELSYVSSSGSVVPSDAILILASIAAAVSGLALIATLPESLVVRLGRLPAVIRTKPVYGFGTMLSIGLGATLGSPLFVLIPQNIMQYELISLLSLVIATVLSVGMAKVYANMYVESKRLGLGGLGGPSFTKLACGTRSARYFISRLSMWVANTALAAYSKIIFIIFDFEVMPPVLSSLGVSSAESTIIVWGVALFFIGWTILNVIFEQKYLKLTGLLQIVLTLGMILLLLYHIEALGSFGSWNIDGLLHLNLQGDWAAALVINTGYLYLLFFGFQEIQSLEREALETSPIPIVSWIKRGYRVSKTSYLGMAMVGSVVIAAAINIFYALAVYSVHPSLASVDSAQIPALYLATHYLGSFQGLIVSVAFLIATATTFVPAFLAASRHLAALGEDGYMPRSLAKLSWLFTLASIFLLAVSNQNFLINVTDFMVLVSLGLISLSEIWMRRKTNEGWGRKDVLPFLVGASCFVAGGAIYFLGATVIVFGSATVVFAYLIFDMLELGVLGTELFLSIFNIVCFLALSALTFRLMPVSATIPWLPIEQTDPYTTLLILLPILSLILVGNIIVDTAILRRTAL